MKTTKKALLLALCAVLLVVSTVFATLAYLTSTTEVVKNTFTVGDIVITLDEAPVDVYGDEVSGDRRTTNDYKLIPGHNYLKDPTIHVAKGSEECYLFVKVTDEIAAIQDTETVLAQMKANGWLSLTDEEGVYYLEAPIDAREAAIDVHVFEDFTIKVDAKVAGYEGKTITVQAYAVQADGFADAEAAWEAASATWTVNP